MKYLLALSCILLIGLSSCKKEDPLTEPAFELISSRISGSDDSSFQFQLQGTGHILINNLIQKPNGEYLLIGRFISKIRGANNQKFIANLHTNGELAWFKILNINESVSFTSTIIRLVDGNINLFAISESNLPPMGYARKINLFQLNSAGEVLFEKVYGPTNVLAKMGDVNLSNDKTVILTDPSQSTNNDQYSIVDVNSGQIESQKTLQGNVLSTTYLSDNSIVFTFVKQQVAQNGTIELLKVNSNGDSLWSIENIAGDNQYIRAVTATDNGSFIAMTASNLSPGPIKVTKYDNTGNVIWNYSNDNASPQECSSLEGTDYFYAGNSAQGIEVNKLDLETGESIWKKTIPNSLGTLVFKIYPTNDGGILILFAPTLNNKYFLQKIDSNGN